MRIQYLSDLHLESHAFTLKVNPLADVLVLAGDLAPRSAQHRLRRLLAETGEIPTIYLPGNHEFYNSTMEHTKRELTAICADFPNVHLLDDTWVDIRGVRFIGSTLWSDFRLPFWQRDHFAGDPMFAQELAERGISDFRKVHGLSADKMVIMHRQACELIRLGKRYGGQVVVCTHFLPSPRSIDPQFAKSTLNPYFASDCEDLMGGNVQVWIHGHTHSSCDYTVNGTHVVCNPRGYTKEENPAFNSQALVEIP